MNTTFNQAIDNAIANAPVSAKTAWLTPEQAVDRLAYIKSAISALKEEETMCKDILITGGMRAYESDFYRVTVAEVAGGTKTNWQALAMSMKPSKQRMAAYIESTAGYFRVDVRAKKTS
jgi:hypothetical protein